MHVISIKKEYIYISEVVISRYIARFQSAKYQDLPVFFFAINGKK